jgi:uncharacterized phage-like protein YoqJ
VTTALFETAETWTTAMVTAHRKLPKDAEQWLRPALRARLGKLRADFGTEQVISGMALGGDMMFAEEALELNLPLTAAVPFPGQARDEHGPAWSQAQQRRWQSLLDRATCVEWVSPTDPLSYNERVRMLHARNDWMLQRSQVVLAIWAPANRKSSGTYSCIVKAVSAGKPVILFNLATKTVIRPSRQTWANELGIPALAAAARR